MTQPDKWEEEAQRCVPSNVIDYPMTVRNIVATALRSAYAEGEKAGMERAAVIAEERQKYADDMNEEYAREKLPAYFLDPDGYEIAMVIRAAKETKT